jgi:hypothetical protein
MINLFYYFAVSVANAANGFPELLGPDLGLHFRGLVLLERKRNERDKESIRQEK